MKKTVISNSESDTDKIGACIAASIETGLVVALNGTLGAGKTRLVQAIGSNWGVNRRDLVSPTFTLCTSHQGQQSFSHIDVYRLADDDHWLELEFDEMIDDGKIVFIEWAEKFSHLLPDDRLEISIEIQDVNQREFQIESLGPQSAAVLDRFAKCLKLA